MADIASGMPNSDSADLAADQYTPNFVDRWDDLIDWERRKASEADFFVYVLEQIGARNVLDAATGTGFHSVALLDAGFEVMAADVSTSMLSQARKNASQHGHQLATLHADWRSLSDHVGSNFDAVICLGSSFPHLCTKEDQRCALDEFYKILRPGGLLIVDHRNFDAIRADCYQSSGNYYYCGASVSVSCEYVDENLCRFHYDFTEGESYTLEVFPILLENMHALLKGSGFADVDSFGDFQREFDLRRVDFLIHVARKT